MARKIGDLKLAYIDKTKQFGENEESSLHWFFFLLEPSHMTAVDACKVSKVWVG